VGHRNENRARCVHSRHQSLRAFRHTRRQDRTAEYEAGPYKGYGQKIQEAFAAIVPPDADAGKVAEAIVGVVDAPFGKRPFRVHIDPTQDGAEVAFAVIDRVRTEMLHRVGLDELLTPQKTSAAKRMASN
jgi:hypothetical protein